MYITEYSDYYTQLIYKGSERLSPVRLSGGSGSGVGGVVRAGFLFGTSSRARHFLCLKSFFDRRTDVQAKFDRHTDEQAHRRTTDEVLILTSTSVRLLCLSSQL
jgi:hypothetical protein